MGWIWYRLGQVKTNRLVADDGSTDADVGGRDTSEDQSPAGCTPVAALPADGRGLPNNAIAHRWETSRPTVRLWQTRFNEAEPVGSVREYPAWASAHRLSSRKFRAGVEATRQTTPSDPTPWRTPRESAMPAWRGSRVHTAGTRTGSKRSSCRRTRGVWRR